MWPGWTGARIAAHVPVPCCSSHFFLLLFCYLPFLVALLIRQLVDWLVNVCTTLWTCKVLIQCSLLFLLCFCLFFLAFLMWLRTICVLCCHRTLVRSWLRLQNPQCNPPAVFFILNPALGHMISPILDLSLLSHCSPPLLGACKSEIHAALIWNSWCVI